MRVSKHWRVQVVAFLPEEFGSFRNAQRACARENARLVVRGLPPSARVFEVQLRDVTPTYVFGGAHGKKENADF